MKTYLFHSRSQFQAPVKNCHFLQFIHKTNWRVCRTLYVGLARTAPSTNTKFQLRASLILIGAILSEICTFTVGFSCTAWTKMTSLQAN